MSAMGQKTRGVSARLGAYGFAKQGLPSEH